MSTKEFIEIKFLYFLKLNSYLAFFLFLDGFPANFATAGRFRWASILLLFLSGEAIRQRPMISNFFQVFQKAFKFLITLCTVRNFIFTK